MNPKEFGWTEDQQVTVKNPTEKDFAFKVHNKDYVVPAGKTVKMPGYIAWVYVYHISVQEAQNTNAKVDENKNKSSDFSHWNEEGFRQQYFEKFVVGTDALVQTVEEVEPEIEFEDVDDDEEVAPTSKTLAKDSTIKPMKRRTRKKN